MKYRHFRRTVIALLAAAAFLLIFFAVLRLVLDSNRVRSWTALALTRLVGTSLHAAVAIDDLQWEMVPPRVRLRGVTVDSTGLHGEIDRLVVDLLGIRLAPQAVDLGTVAAEGVRLRLSEGGAGRWQSGGNLPFDITVRHLDLREFEFQGSDLPGLESIDIDGLALSWVRQGGAPHGWLRLDSLLFDAVGVEPVEIALRGRFALVEGLVVPSLAITGRGLQLTGRAAIGADGRATAELSGEIDLDELNRVVGTGNLLEGQVAVEVRADSSSASPLTARVLSEQVEVAGFELTDIDATLSLAPDQLDGVLHRARFSDGRISGTYRLGRLRGPFPHMVSARAEGVDLAALLEALGVPPAGLAASVDADVGLNWNSDRIKQGTGSCNARLLPVDGWFPVDGSVSVDLSPPGVLYMAAEGLEIGGSTVSWQGPLTLGTWEPSWLIRAEPAVVEEWVSMVEAWIGQAFLPPGLTGVGDLEVALSGPWRRLQVGLRLDAHQLAFREVAVDRAVIEGTIRESELILGPVRYQVGAGSGLVGGRINWGGKDARLDLVTRGKSIPLNRVVGWFGIDPMMTGEASFAGGLSGSVDQPRGSWALALTGVTASGVPLGDGSASVELDGAKVSVHGLAFDGGLEGRVRYDVVAHHLAAEVHWPEMALEPLGAAVQALFGARADLDAAVDWQGAGLPLGWCSLTGDGFRIEATSEGAELQLAGEITDAARGRMILQPVAQGGLVGQGDVMVHDVARLLEHIEVGTGESVAGSGRLELVFEVSEAGRPELDLSLVELGVVVSERRLELLQPAVLVVSPDGLQLDRLHLRVGSDVVETTVSVAPDGGLSGHVKGSLDASLLRPLLPDWETAGRLSGRVALVGSLATPQVQGMLEVSAGSFRLPGSLAVVSRIYGSTLLSPNEFTFDGVTYRFMNGDGTVSGQIVLADEDVELRLNGSVKGLAFPLVSGLEPRVSGAWRLVGPVDELELSGDLTVDRAALRRRDDLAAMILDWMDEIPAPSAPSGVGLDIHLTADRSLSARGPFLNVVGSASLDLLGDLNRLGLVGRLDLEEGGDFTFQGVRYEIERCSITFSDPTRIDPIIDLQVRAWVQSYMITVRVSGTLDRLAPTVSSDPPLDQEGIYSLLALGHRNEAIGAGAVGVGLASALLTRQINQELERRARLILPVDQVRVDPFLESSTGNPAARMTVVKQLSPRWTIIVQSNLSSDRQEVVLSRWNLGPGLFLEAIRDLDGTFGIDLKLRTRY